MESNVTLINMSYLILKIFFITHLSICMSQNTPNNSFINYMQRFSPSHVWEGIENKTRHSGQNITVKERFHEIYNHIDPTDELLKLKVKNGNPEVLLQKDGRRWKAPIDNKSGNKHDKFYLRPRILELMKQAIYQARRKMVIMQNLRQKYSNVSVYKMGFLMSKTDTACKKFSSIAYKATKHCGMARQDSITVNFHDMVEYENRLLKLWFDVDLLRELVDINDKNCERMLQQTLTNRKKAWKFID